MTAAEVIDFEFRLVTPGVRSQWNPKPERSVTLKLQFAPPTRPADLAACIARQFGAALRRSQSDLSCGSWTASIEAENSLTSAYRVADHHGES